MKKFMLSILAGSLLMLAMVRTTVAPPNAFAVCNPTGVNCNVLITLTKTGVLQITTNTSQPYYPMVGGGWTDIGSLVGFKNEFNSPVHSLRINAHPNAPYEMKFLFFQMPFNAANVTFRNVEEAGSNWIDLPYYFSNACIGPVAPGNCPVPYRTKADVVFAGGIPKGGSTYFSLHTSPIWPAYWQVFRDAVVPSITFQDSLLVGETANATVSLTPPNQASVTLSLTPTATGGSAVFTQNNSTSLTINVSTPVQVPIKGVTPSTGGNILLTATVAGVQRGQNFNVPAPQAVIEGNSTPDQNDDITVVNPQQVLPIKVTLNNGSATVDLAVTPAGRATLSSPSLVLANGGNGTVDLTPLVKSTTANDVTITASIGGVAIGTETLTIANVSFPSIRASNTPMGMVDRIPTRVDTAISVTVEPDLTGSGQSVTIATLNTSPNNGDFTIGGAATQNVLKTGDVQFRGTAQTAPTPAPGGGNAGNLRAVARVRGQDAVQSAGFSVAVIPVTISESFFSLASALFPGNLGIVVSMDFTNSSDSGVQGDLDQVALNEVKEVKPGDETGTLVGIGAGPIPPPFPMVGGAPGDVHSLAIAILVAPGGTQRLHQLHTFNDLRTGVANQIIAASGYLVDRVLVEDPPGSGLFAITVTKSAAPVTIGAQTVAAGLISPPPGPITRRDP